MNPDGIQPLDVAVSGQAFLAQLRERRDHAVANAEHWALSSEELIRAHDQGERDFAHAHLAHAHLAHANLRNANLADAHLAHANLLHAHLAHANLRNAHLAHANLAHANLRNANLRNAHLAHANLAHANLLDAHLAHATLWNANLSDANLRNAHLAHANLAHVHLSDAHADFLTKCLKRPHELAGLRLALVEGRVDSNVYEGECACFVGTLANIAHCDRSELGIEVNAASPVERLFLAIHKGSTPENNPVSQIVVEWLDELLAFSAVFQVKETT